MLQERGISAPLFDQHTPLQVAVALGLDLSYEIQAVPIGDEIPLIGRLLFSDYLLAFEALSFLLLVAAVGALLLSKRRFE